MPKILLVEDDNNLREIFQMRLQAEGYETVTAGDGEEALVVAVKEKPDLVIADVMMPKLSGFEMVENMRASAGLAQVKVIMMTALGQAEDRTRGDKLGVVKYLVKSQVTLEDFVRVVREVLPPSQEGAAASEPSAQPDNAAKPQEELATTNIKESENSMQDDAQANPSTNPGDAGAAPADGVDATNPISGAPAADPSVDAAPAADAQTTAQEQSTVNNQINDFASNASGAPSVPAADPSAAPASDPVAEPAADPSVSPEPADVPVSSPPADSGMPASDPVAPPAPDPNSPAPGTADTTQDSASSSSL
jgi:DNA-binding response OmpR family regulator